MKTWFLFIMLVFSITLVLPCVYAETSFRVVILKNSTSSISCTQDHVCLSLQNLSIPIGSEVTWQNNDSVAHTITNQNPSDSSVDGAIFDSGIISPKGMFTYNFTTSGTYNYFDQLHPWITGIVIVGQGIEPKISSPLHQFNSGVPIQKIECKQGYQLTIKLSQHTPACFSPPTVWHMFNRGWSLVESENPDLNVNYGIILQERITINIEHNGTGSDLTLYPKNTSVTRGINSTIVFVNKDSIPHYVADDDLNFVSRVIQPGQKWIHTFNSANTLHYHTDTAQGILSIRDDFLPDDVKKKFQSELISKEQALKIADRYIQENNLSKIIGIEKAPNFVLGSDLTYAVLSKGYSSWYHIDQTTGLPVEEVPGWWAELEKDYVGLPSHRIDDGNVVWYVTYSDCSNCIAQHPTFFIDAITGQILVHPDEREYG